MRNKTLCLGCCTAAILSAFAGVARADCSPSNTGTAGADRILCDEQNDAAGADVDALGGNDTLDLHGGTIGNAYGGMGDDTINIGLPTEDDDEPFDPNNPPDTDEPPAPPDINEGKVTIQNRVNGGSGNDTIILNNRLSRVGDFLEGGGIHGGSGDDSIQILDGMAFDVWGGEGNDEIILDGGFAYNAIHAGDGDDTIYWDEGITGGVYGGNGSDRLVLDSFAYNSNYIPDDEAFEDINNPILDGGDDLHAEDGQIDTLVFILDYPQDARLLRNWERIVIWGSSKMQFFGELSVGGGKDPDGNDLGLDILFGGLVQFIPREFSVTGNIASAGTLDLAYNGRFDTLTLHRDADGRYGNFIGKDGRLWMDARLGGDGAPADLFRIEGNVSGRTFVKVINRGGLGAQTHGDGIKLMEIAGNSPADAFMLDGDFIARDGQPATVGGAYAYTLQHNGVADSEDGNWYLRSVVTHPRLGPGEMPRWQPGAVMYETYPQILRSLNRPGSLRERVGNRFWIGSSYKDPNNCDYTTAVERTIDSGGPWLRAGGHRKSFNPQESSSRASWEQDYFFAQLGIDVPLNFTVIGSAPIASAALHYGNSENDVESFYGDGNIDVEHYGIGGFLTWYSPGGTYLDTQVLLNWFDTNLTAFDLRKLPRGENAFGYTLSVEGGRSFPLRDLYSITPQLQLIYSKEEADDLHDVYDVKVTDINNNGYLMRLGATFDKRVSRRKSSGNMYGELPLERFALYATPSILYNFDNKTHATVSSTSLFQQEDNWLGELSIGATYDECGDYCSVYGEVSFTGSLENPGDSNGIGLEFGFRYKW